MSRNIAPRYAPKRIESEIKRFWEEHKAYERSKEKRSRGQDVYLLDSMHSGRDGSDPSIVYSMMVKDAVVKHLRMRGYNVRDVPGIEAYDGEVEKEAMDALGLDDEAAGESAEEYVKECRKSARNMAEHIKKEFSDMGIWMDWKKAYTPVDSKYMEGVWYAFKELNSRGLLGRFRGISQWCPSCRTFLPKSDLKVEKEWKKGVYVKFPLKNRNNTYLISWFSEPWKLTATLALEISPSKKYSIVEIKGGRERIIIGSDELHTVLEECGIKEWKKAGEIPGEKLAGSKYMHPLFGSVSEDDDIIDIGLVEDEELKIDRVISGTKTGRTGIRPLVPAHSNTDLALAERNGIKVLSPVSDSGELGDSTGKYRGFNIFDAESIIIRDLINGGMALSAYDVMESTAHCRRCGSRTIPMMSEEWSFRAGDVGDALESALASTEWIPSWMMGSEYEQSVPVPISKKGLWGVPMPVWVCSCGHTEVVGSTVELEKLSPEFRKGMGIHRPWIDGYTLKCPRCGGSMHRVKEVLLPDFSAMAASWAQLHYPSMESEYRRWWPADMVIEPIGRSRSWIFLQMAGSSAIFGRGPFKKVIGTGKIRSQDRGLSALFKEYGTDLVRYALMSSGRPWDSRDIEESRLQSASYLFNRIWNIHRFLSLYYRISEFKPEEVSIETVHEFGMPIDRWMISVLENSRDKYVRAMEEFRLDEASDVIESLTETISTWYLRAVRSRIRSADMNRRDVLSGYRTLYEAVMVLLRMLAPFSPYIAEKMYQDIGGKEASVFVEEFSAPNKLLIDHALDVRMEITMDIIRSGRKARRKAGIPVRWPVSRIVVKAASKEVMDAVNLFGDFIRDELNVKTIETVPPAQEWEEMILEVQPNPDAIGLVYRQWSSRIAVMLRNRPAKRIREEIRKGEYYLGIEGQMVKIEPNMVRFVSSLPEYVVEERFLDGSVYLDTRRDESLLVEGRMREIVRRVQDMRKDLDLSFNDYIDLYIAGNEEIEEAVMEWGEEMAEMAHAREIVLTNEEGMEGEYMVEWYIEGEPVTIGIEPLYWEEMVGVLSRIPGMNRQKAEAVFDAGYTNLAMLLDATEDELSNISGISPAYAKKLKGYLKKNFGEGAPLVKVDEGYECGVCGAGMSEPEEICPKCHLPLHLKEERNEEEIQEEEERNEFLDVLSGIKGIGPSRAKMIYESGYHSIEDLKNAGISKIASIKRMSPALAELLFKNLGIEVEGSSPAEGNGMSEEDFVKEITKVKGLGPSRARKIYRSGYRSLDDLRRASIDEIAAIPRMSRALAEMVKEFVGSEEGSEESEPSVDFKPQKGGLYIFDRDEDAYSALSSKSLDSVLCLTGRENRKSEIKNSEMVLVSGSADKALRPNELDKIALTIDKWMVKKGEKALLMDVLDHIISENSFDSAMRFLDYLREEGARHDFFTVLSFHLNSLPDEKKKILREKADYLG